MNENEIKIPEINTPEDAAKYAVKILDERKAKDIKLLHVFDHTVIADYFVICTGNSTTQVSSLADEVEYRLSLAGHPAAHIEGDGKCGWILLDFSSVIVHVFTPQAKEFYNLEKLYSEDAEVDISELLTEE